MQIIDSHAHIFQFLGGKSGFRSQQEHLDEIQRMMHFFKAQPVKRKKDNSIVEEETLWDPNKLDITGKYEVNFRVTKNGRFEWTKDGIDYYLHFMPANLQNMESPPDFLITMMEYAGVDKAVLQCADVYGKLNYYYIWVINEYPDAFFPLYRPDENLAYTISEINQLKLFVKLGFKAIWFKAHKECFSDKFDSFWDVVKLYRLPVFWSFWPEYEGLKYELLKWTDRYREIKNIIAQSFPISIIKKGNKFMLPETMKGFTKKDNVLFELAYPIAVGGVEDYPYPNARQAIEFLYNIFGGEKFVWGTDIPNVERYCTYAQSLNYIKDYCDFIPKYDKDLILGGNLEKIFEKSGVI
jgi:predicted TIM-barrel fold metal-dependent hydrolase